MKVGFLQPYIRKHWRPFCGAIFFLTLEALADLAQPTIMAIIIDVGVAEQRMDVVWRMGSLMLLVTALGAIAASTRNILAGRVSQKFGTELRLDLFRKVQFLSFENLDKFDRASLVTRMTNDVTQVQMFVNGLMRIFVKAPLLCIGSLIMAARLNPNLALILAVVVPVVALLIAFNMKVGFPRFMRVQKALDQVNGVMREYLSGVRVVKAFNRFTHETDKFNKASTEYQGRSIAVMRTMSFFNPAIMLTMNLGIITVIWLGGIRVDNGQMQVGTIIAFVNYMTQILFALMTISMVFNMFVRARASAVRIGEVFTQVETMKWEVGHKPGAGVGGGRIDFEDVSFSYEGMSGTSALRHITFTCLPGETVGIIGATGSGKSSLVNLIPRFYDSDSGTVRVNGTDVKLLDPRVLRETIAVVPQKTVLFSGTIEDNIRWGKEEATREEIESAARAAEAHGFISEFPEGYRTRLGQRGVNLSGGQKQRISIARAWIRSPEILILDDCTSAVDMTTEARIKEALKKAAGSFTCLIIAQRITSIMDADQIVVLDDGELAGLGKHEALLESCRVYREIYESQMGRGVKTDVQSKGANR